VAADGPESVSTQLAGPVPAPPNSLPAGSPPSSGSHGVSGSAGPSQVGLRPGVPQRSSRPPTMLAMFYSVVVLREIYLKCL